MYPPDRLQSSAERLPPDPLPMVVGKAVTSRPPLHAVQPNPQPPNQPGQPQLSWRGVAPHRHEDCTSCNCVADSFLECRPKFVGSSPLDEAATEGTRADSLLRPLLLRVCHQKFMLTSQYICLNTFMSGSANCALKIHVINLFMCFNYSTVWNSLLENEDSPVTNN